MSNEIIVIIIIASFTIITDIVYACLEVKRNNNLKKISSETGIPYEEVKSAFKEHEKIAWNMWINHYSMEEIAKMNKDFYNKLNKYGNIYYQRHY
jgi:hypothetical protein